MDFNSLIVFQVEKEDISTLSLERAEKTLSTLKETGKPARGALAIMFSGYDDIPDEVFEIPAIREWSAKFVDRNPEVFYFLNRELQSDQMILTTLCDVSSFHVGEATKSPEEYYKSGIDPMDLPKKQLQLSLPDGLREKITSAVIIYGDSVGDPNGARSALSIFDIFD